MTVTEITDRVRPLHRWTTPAQLHPPTPDTKTPAQMHAEPFREASRLLRQIAWLWWALNWGAGGGTALLLVRHEYWFAVACLASLCVPCVLMAFTFDWLSAAFGRIARDIETCRS